MSVELPAVITNQRLEWQLEEIFKTWRRNEPEDSELFLAQMAEKRKQLLKPTAITQEGYFLLLAEIPKGIDKLMNWVFGPNWKDNPKVATPFYRRFESLRVNTTSLPDYSKVHRDPDPGTHDAWTRMLIETLAEEGKIPPA